jgi:hypothetical protein
MDIGSAKAKVFKPRSRQLESENLEDSSAQVQRRHALEHRLYGQRLEVLPGEAYGAPLPAKLEGATSVGPADLWNWPGKYLDAFEDNFPGTKGTLMDSLVENFVDGSYSSAYAGIDAPGTALESLRAEAAVRHGEPIRSMPHEHATEINDACKRELAEHPSPPCHIFHDTEDLWTRG